MLVSKVDYNLLSDIMRLKDTVKQSVDSVMEGALTASHLASDVYTLLDELDKLEQSWRATPPTEEMAQPGQPAEAPPPAAPVQEAPPVAETPAEQAPPPAAPVQEAPPVAETPAEQAPPPAAPVQEAPPPAEALPVEEIPAEEELAG